MKRDWYERKREREIVKRVCLIVNCKQFRNCTDKAIMPFDWLYLYSAEAHSEQIHTGYIYRYNHANSR